jgi:hypothetical protein
MPLSGKLEWVQFSSTNAQIVRRGFYDGEVSHMIYGGSIFELGKFYDA